MINKKFISLTHRHTKKYRHKYTDSVNALPCNIGSMCYDNNNTLTFSIFNNTNDKVAIKSINLEDKTINTLMSNFSYNIWGVTTNKNNPWLIYSLNNVLHVCDKKTTKLLTKIPTKGTCNQVTLSKDGNHLSYITQPNKVTILNAHTLEKILSLTIPHTPLSIAFSHDNKYFAFSDDTKLMHLFEQYEHPTHQQLMLRKILQLWMLVKKPDKRITSIESLLSAVASLFRLQHNELSGVWNTFTEPLQQAIWTNMDSLIQTYGI